MATYAELADIYSDSGFGSLQQKTRVAVVVKATALLDLAAPTALQVDWAKVALKNPAVAAEDVLWYIIAANKDFTVAQITGASDTAVQTNVDAAVDKIVSVV